MRMDFAATSDTNGSINNMAFGQEVHGQGQVSDGAVTGTVIVDCTSRSVPLKISWTAMDDVVLSPLADYLIRTAPRGNLSAASHATSPGSSPSSPRRT
ncbi:hypothetical protein GTW37_10760 [Streptomyces sp. SID4931]|nr:hypothetical protein [Streptomyces sp. SID4931]